MEVVFPTGSPAVPSMYWVSHRRTGCLIDVLGVSSTKCDRLWVSASLRAQRLLVWSDIARFRLLTRRILLGGEPFDIPSACRIGPETQ